MGPAGRTQVASEISVVFSRPVRALGGAGEAVTLPLKLTPELPGRWTWLGSQAVVFVPTAGRLPYASTISLEVPAGIVAVDGSRLPEARKLELSTPLPEVVDVRSEDFESTLGPHTALVVTFNQPIELSELSSRLRLLVGESARARAVAMRVTPMGEPPSGLRFRLVPDGPLPANTEVALGLEGALHGREGQLVSKSPLGRAPRFHTYRPLRVKAVECDMTRRGGACGPGQGARVVFSNPVRVGRVRSSLTVNGRRARLSPWQDDDYQDSTIRLDGPFAAGTTATVAVAAGVEDIYGQRLPAAFKQELHVADLDASVAVGVTGKVFDPALPIELPVGAVNLPSYELLDAWVEPEALWPILAGARAGGGSLGFGEVLGAIPGLSAQRQVGSSARNKLAVAWVHPTGSSRRQGTRLVGLRYERLDDENKATAASELNVFGHTDIGVTAHVGRHGSFVWATRLSDGGPRPQAKVRVVSANGHLSPEFTTDASGLVRLPAGAIAPEVIEKPWNSDAALIVRDGDDRAWFQISDAVDEWRVGVPVDRRAVLPIRSVVFAERGLYRPGEKVSVQTIVRREELRGLSVLAKHGVTLGLLAPSGREFAKTSRLTNAFGTASAELALPEFAETGPWQVRVQVAGEELGAEAPFTVAEYRPVEISARVEPGQREVVRGARVPVLVSAETLFGLALKDAAVRYSVRRAPAAMEVPHTSGYSMESDAYYQGRREQAAPGHVTTENAKLDEAGQLKAEANAELPGARGAEWMDIEAEVTDLSQNPVVGRARIKVMPADVLAGIAIPERTFVPVSSAQTIGIAAFDSAGNRLAGQRGEVELLRRRWSTARRVENGEAWVSSEAVDSVAARCTVTTATKDVPCTFVPGEPGEYVVVARMRDGKGRTHLAAMGLFAVGDGNAGFREEPDKTITLLPDKPLYKVGDTAQILVKSGVGNCDGVVAIEQRDLRDVRLQHFSGGATTIEVPITADFRPNVYVSVHLVEGRRSVPKANSEKPDLGAPTYRMGWTELRVDSGERRLTVDLSPKAMKVLPGATVELAARVTDSAGKPVTAQVTLWAVDEAVLSLSSYGRVDPSETFFAPRPLGLVALDNREMMAQASLGMLRERLGLSKGEVGGGGGDSSGTGNQRQDFRATAFFLPNLVTDRDGRVKAKLRLPDGVTRYHVFALGVAGADQFGFAEDAITTARPLVARPLLPRFFTKGDSSRVSVVVSAPELQAQAVTVRMKARGLSPSEASASVNLARGESKKVGFDVRAVGGDLAHVEFGVSAGAVRDDVVVERPVRTPFPLEVVATSGELAPAVLEKIAGLSKVHRDIGGLTVALSSSLLSGAVGSMVGLLEYPYECTEQLASRLLALVSSSDLAVDAKLRTRDELRQSLDSAIAKISARQRPDGGFSLWAGSGESSPWASVHALFALHQASAMRGGEMAGAALGKEYLRQLLEEPAPAGTSESVRLALRAYAVDTLCVLGSPNPGSMTRLYEAREQLPDFAKALLLDAYARCGDDRESKRVLLQELERRLRVDGRLARVATPVGDEFSSLMDTNTRTTALLLRAFLAAHPEHAMVAPLVRGLLAERRDGTWSNTQESAFALLTLSAYQKIREADHRPRGARVTLGSEGRGDFSPLLGGSSTVSRNFTMTELGAGGPLLLEAQGATPVFYELELRSLPLVANDTERDAGFGIRRRYYRVARDSQVDAVKDSDENVTRWRLGETVRVELVVVAPRPRDYVVVDDRIPAGFEPIDTQLLSASTETQASDRMLVADNPSASLLSLRRELRDDRACFFVDHMPPGVYRFSYLARASFGGEFRAPAATVEAMYNPELFGRTTTTLVHVE